MSRRPYDGRPLGQVPYGPSAVALHALLGRYESAGEPRSCVPVAQGLLNRGFRLTTTHGRYFLKHHLDGDTDAIRRQHRATTRLALHGLPVAPPVADAHGRTVAVVDGDCYALHPWIDGRHRYGAELSPAQSRSLGALLGQVHTQLDLVIRTVGSPADPADLLSAVDTAADTAADTVETDALIDDLLARLRAQPRRDSFDALAEHRLLERRSLLRRYADHRPPPGAVPATGWVHGDFHPLNVLYRKPDGPDGPDATVRGATASGATASDDRPDEPVAIIDWDRLGRKPRTEETVRAALIFFVRPDGSLDLPRVRAYAAGYRREVGAAAADLAAAVHRVWWERLNDFWMLCWRYRSHDRRPDPLFPAASALVLWWTRHYAAVRDAFSGASAG